VYLFQSINFKKIDIKRTIAALKGYDRFSELTIIKQNGKKHDSCSDIQQII
jgi:hypothetical protein